MKQSISICIITKNEADKLEVCLKHIKPYAIAGNHEIVVVDTGSTDNTMEMCKKYTCSIYEFAWIDDFSAARNYAASKAKNNWILCIDSDENITNWNEAALQTAISNGNHTLGTIDIINHCGFGKDAYDEKSILYRLYNKVHYTFKHAIHEQLTNLFPQEKETNMHTKITIFHNSYAGTKEELLPKTQRNIALLEKELRKNPNDAFTLYNLGQCYYMREDFQRALDYYGKGLEQDIDIHAPWAKNMIVSYGYCLLNLNQSKKALDLEGLYETFSEYADFVFLIGYIYMKNGYFDDAIAQFQRATTLSDYAVLGSNSYRAWFNIGIIYECAGYIDLAKEYYEKCGDYAPAAERLNGISTL